MQLSTSLRAEWKGEGSARHLELTEATDKGPVTVRVPMREARMMTALVHTEVQSQKTR